MKGDVLCDPSLKEFVVIVHSWDNVLCMGEPEDWRAVQVFPAEDAALQYYKTNIRPELEKMILQMGKSGANSAHRKLVE